MDLSIIIVNWNSFNFLRSCLGSIYEKEIKAQYEVIVFDNFSNEKEIRDLNNYYSDVKLILGTENMGFAKANNLASKYATGDALLFLNPDTLLKDNILDGVHAFLSNNKETIGIVGPKIVNSDGLIQKDAARYLPSLFSMFCNIFLLKRLFENNGLFSEYIRNYDTPQEVEFISGACLAIRRDLFDKIGGFSEDYFMYCEDDDICYKAIKRGFHNFYLSSYEIVHIGSASSNKTVNSKMFECWFFKSRGIYFAKRSIFLFILLSIIYIMGSIFRIFLATSILICKSILKKDFNALKYYILVIRKYSKILLFGLGIDTIR